MLFLVFVDKGAWVVATPDGVWHRDSHKWRKFIGGDSQGTYLNKGNIGIIFAKFLRRRNGWGQGDPDPLVRTHGRR